MRLIFAILLLQTLIPLSPTMASPFWGNRVSIFLSDDILSLEEELPKTGQVSAGVMEESDNVHVVDVQVTDYHTISIQFSQSVPVHWQTKMPYVIEGFSGSVISVTAEGEGVIFLHLDAPLPDAVELSLVVQEFLLDDGVTLLGGRYPLYYHEAARHDVVFTEVMADPVPEVLLPGVEYLELFNRSDLPVDLFEMELMVQKQSVKLPRYMLFPGEYVVLCSVSSAEETAAFPHCLLLPKLPVLPNSGGRMVLRNPSGAVVTFLDYPEIRSGEVFKREGGWSAELRDPDNLSGSDDNWGYSVSLNGGTPGEANSLLSSCPDLQPPFIEDAWLKNDSVMVLLFSEAMGQITPQDRDEGFVLQSDDSYLSSVLQDSVTLQTFTLIFGHAFPEDRILSLEIGHSLVDFAGNPFAGPYTFEFGKPVSIDSMDVVINELLFDPPEGGCDYVELFNRSSHIADLSRLCLSRASSTGEPEKLVSLSDRCRWFLPGWHLCFASDPEWVKGYYSCESPRLLRALKKLPNYVNEGGTVFLSLRNGEVIDLFTYTPKAHFVLLSNTSGVALERTLADGPTNDPMTWHSASGAAGYGTPTGINSQHVSREVVSGKKLFNLSPDVFTPDQDGMDDVLVISYALDEPGHVGSFVIFDSSGRERYRLVNNHSLGTSGQIVWDGADEQGQLCPPGIYIVWGRIFDLQGRVRTYKTTCVLGIKNRN